ncbi:MAG: ribonuclease P protein component [Candidatus Glassbacteria bacterium]|nr:ribonuclease P protein component [Candidatus Glassbacteria bacterium]
MGYPRKSTIRQSSEISRVIRQGRCYRDELLRINVLPQEIPAASRAAFIVPRFGRTVVKRNRLKRRLHEIMRSCSGISLGFLLVVRVVPEAYDVDFRELENRFSTLAARIVGA